MNDGDNINETVTGSVKPEYKYAQGIHAGTFKRFMYETYGCEICDRVDRWRSEDGKWFDVFYIPILLDELQPKHQERVVEEVFSKDGEKIGVNFIVRNYHIKDKLIAEIEEVVGYESKQAVVQETDGLSPQQRYYQRNKEKLRECARQQWQKNKDNVEYREKRRARSREYQREKHRYTANTSEQVRRNMNRQTYNDAIEIMNVNEQRIADLMAKDELGTITEIEILELEQLLNIEGGTDERTDSGELPEMQKKHV